VKEPLLRPAEIQELLGISRAAAYQLLQRGEIASVRIGRSVRVTPADLEAFIQRSRSARSTK
jgi:excisionase family DNA binding protein